MPANRISRECRAATRLTGQAGPGGAAYSSGLSLLASLVPVADEVITETGTVLHTMSNPAFAGLPEVLIGEAADEADMPIADVRNLPEDDADQARSKLQAQLSILRDGRREEEAYALISQANQKTPDDADLLYDLALSAEKLGRPDEMEKILRRVITLQPDYHAAYNALGYSLADRNQRLPEARELIEKALKFAPNDPFILDSLAWVEFRIGNKAEAVRILRAAYATRPDAEIAAHLGEVLWAMNLREEANAAWAKGLELNRDNDTLKSTIVRLRGSL